MCLDKNEEDLNCDNKVIEDQFTSEKLKVNLRQRAAKTKRPISRKFRNSMVRKIQCEKRNSNKIYLATERNDNA